MEFKYDKTQQKILRIVATVCTILPLLAILMGKYLFGRMPILIIAVIFKGVPLALGTWVLYGESLLYFRELRRHGIEPPLHKNDAADRIDDPKLKNGRHEEGDQHEKRADITDDFY